MAHVLLFQKQYKQKKVEFSKRWDNSTLLFQKKLLSDTKDYLHIKY